MPGQYSLGDVASNSLEMQSHVHVVGSGQGNTVISGNGGTFSKGVVTFGIGQTNSALRDLTIHHLGGSSNVSAIAATSGVTDVDIESVTVIAEGQGTSQVYGMRLGGSNSVYRINSVRAFASGGNGPTGIFASGNVLVDDAHVEVGPGAIGAIGIFVSGTGAVTDSHVIGRDGGSNLNQTTAGIQVSAVTTFDVLNSKVEVSSALGRAYAINASGNGKVRVSNTVLDATAESSVPSAVGIYTSADTFVSSSVLNAGGIGYRIGVQVGSDAVVEVNSSTLVGAINVVYASGPSQIRIGGSQMAGGPIQTFNGATVTCAGVFDEAYLFNVSSCPP